MTVYAGIDLHSSNSYVGIINENNKPLFSKRLPNNLSMIESALEPFKHQLAGVVVESTYNWYWLVDGLQEAGYLLHLANPAGIKQYEGIKHTNDQSDALWLARMLQLGILPEGYIYSKDERPVRDLLRRRLLYVRQKTAHILSLKSMVIRNLGRDISTNDLKKCSEEEAADLFEHIHLKLAARNAIATIHFMTKRIRAIEKEVMAHVKIKPAFEWLMTIPGIGRILGITIMLEIGDINRFEGPGHYASYCRCVKSIKLSNDKKKGSGNRKNGNKYLAWAYVEAANFAIRYYPKAKRFYDRKSARTNNTVARKALANKIARASYHIMKNQVAFEESKMFK